MFLTFLYFLSLFILGAAVGSFTSVLIYRLHSGKKGIFRGRSHCPECETQLRPIDLVPIASYLSLRGQCRYCSKEISWMYPLLEIVSGGIFALVFVKFPFIDAQLNFDTAAIGLYLLHAFYAFVLIFTFFYDLHYYKVADEILLPAILIGLIATIAFPLTPHFFDAIIGAGLALAFFGFQYLASRGKWIGLGDLRVGAFMGVILGWKMFLVALFVAYILGSVVSIIVAATKKKFFGVKIPFAPLLVTGTFAALFFGQELLDWYL